MAPSVVLLCVAAAEPAAASSAPSVEENQRAAGLEVIDPKETPLETFIRAHDVPERRVGMALSKYGAVKVSDLTAEQAAAILGIFERSYQINEATR